MGRSVNRRLVSAASVQDMGKRGVRRFPAYPVCSEEMEGIAMSAMGATTREGWGWLVELTERLRDGPARDYNFTHKLREYDAMCHEAATVLEAAHAQIVQQAEALRIAEAVLRHADPFETTDDGKIPLHSPFTAARLVRAAMTSELPTPPPAA